MSALLQLVQFSSSRSYSVWVDAHQLYVRRVFSFCTGLSMVRQLFGASIHCQNTVYSLTQDFLDTQCFINGTLTKGPDGLVLYHDYYQWVSVYLLLMSVAIYLPYSLWCQAYGKEIRYLEQLARRPENAIVYLLESKGNGLFWKTWALEAFYWVYGVGLLVLTDIFFNRLWSRFRSLRIVFPDHGKCVFMYHHSSGSTNGSFNCLLPLCSVYRKVFGGLFILVLLWVVGMAVWIVYRIGLVACKGRGVNQWWACTICRQCAGSWKVRKKLNEGMRTRSIAETIV